MARVSRAVPTAVTEFGTGEKTERPRRSRSPVTQAGSACERCDNLGACRFLEDDEVFLANYTDGLSDVDLDRCLEWFRNTGKAASFLAVRPSHTFHVVDLDGGSGVRSILNSTKADLWINGGFFALRPKIFEYMKPGEELVEEPFQRMIEQGDLAAYPFEGFWACMDTFKDKQRFDDMHASGNRPWEVWNRAAS